MADTRSCSPQRPLDVRFAKAAGSIGVGPAGPLGPQGPAGAGISTTEVNNTGPNPTINFATSDLQVLTLSSACAPTLVGPVGVVGWVQIRAVGDGTPRTITWPGTVTGSPPQPNTTGNTYYPFYHNGSTYDYVANASVIIAGNGILDTAGTWSVKLADATLIVGAGGVKRAPISGVVAIADGSNVATMADGSLSRAKLAPETEYDNGTSGTADTIAAANGTYQKSTLTGNCTYTLTPPASGLFEIELRLIQGPGGPYTVTWPALVVWPASGPPTLSTTVGDEDIVVLSWKGTNWYGTTSKALLSQIVPSDTNGRVAVTIGGVSTWGTTLGNFTDAMLLKGLDVTGISSGGVESTLVPRGDATPLTRRFADLVFTDAVVTTATTEVSIVEIDLSSTNFNGAALVNGLVKVRFECEGVQTAGNFYSHAVEKVALIRRSGGTTTLVNTPVDGNSGTGGQLNPSSNAPTVATIKVSGNIVQGRIAPFDNSSTTWFGKLVVMGFDL